MYRPEFTANEQAHDYGVAPTTSFAFEHLGILKGFDWAEKARDDIAEQAKAKGLKDAAASEYTSIHGQQPGQREAKTTALLPSTPETLPHLVDPSDKKADLTKRAKSWLHTNCAMCHVEAGGGNAQMELEFNTALDKMRLLDVKPIHATFDMADAKLVVPGVPERSVLLKRAGLRGKDQMPPLSSNRVDELGVALLREWIMSLKK